ncbi:AraC family transcriptional regulator [Kitasatospora sp. MMS16-BH015]|uniref:AraC family transcriptional regulator n=1 Tax=Kitasatospora sp. MMS16-BH015 TaxID=2018025 RepID=UPI000CA291D2|nr:AraC family transcriptional regulator [Kitasatospora sp. MMS16-BH015]AUG78137.1 AraC family transcriptional regulator [Kitasatospora sp. MMS16-BH015]
MLERLNQAMAYVEEHLDGTIEVTELARIAVTSEYHFRRLFSALAGMPLSEYVRRRRLTLAGAEVLAGERTLLEIAVRYGYGSGEAFARAFRAMHGTGPGEARRQGAVLDSQPRMSFRLVIEGSSSMRYRIVEKPELRVVGRKARVPLIHEGVNPHIAELIQSVGPEEVQRITALSSQEPEGILSVVQHLSDSREEGVELDYYHAVLTEASHPVPDGLDSLVIEAGLWAVFENTGAYPQALQEMWRDVFTQWFPSNPFVIREGPEILRTRPTADWKESDSQLWIPVERGSIG